jgi:DNA-binding NarL/FixJ family response regulator
MKTSISRVLIVDDHPIVLYGLRLLFERDPRFVICGEASDSASAAAMARTLSPDYIILDLVLGGRDGIELLKDMESTSPAASILVFSSQNEWRFARRAIQAGARGYVAKSEGLPMLAHAIDTVARGGIFLSHSVRQRLEEVTGRQDIELRADRIDSLSNRELQVLRLIGEGKRSGEIAAELDLSRKTVGTFSERIKVKLQLGSYRDLETIAREHVENGEARR